MSRVNFPVPTIIIISFPPLLLSPFFMRIVQNQSTIDRSHHHIIMNAEYRHHIQFFRLQQMIARLSSVSASTCTGVIILQKQESNGWEDPAGR